MQLHAQQTTALHGRLQVLMNRIDALEVCTQQISLTRTDARACGSRGVLCWVHTRSYGLQESPPV